MFQFLGSAISRSWHIWLAGWIVVSVALSAVAPEWASVVEDGEFRYLPEEVPSHRGEELFERAFSKDLLGSSVVIVVRRESREDGLLDEDKTFIDEVLKPRLQNTAALNGGLASDDVQDDVGVAAPADDARKSVSEPGRAAESIASTDPPLVSRIRTFSDKSIGHLLESDDKKASLVVLELSTEFIALRNHKLIEEIEDLIGPSGELRSEQLIPPGLDLKLSGSATVGRDMRLAAEQSADATHLWTVLLVITLLIAIYRAPLLALIPIMTVFVSVNIAIVVLSLLAQQHFIELFNGIEIYVTVVLYGAGVDYCMFLMARYKEELDAGASIEDAIANSVGKVGAALAASAGTTMAGIGMMTFAEFGKFRQAGLAMSFSLTFVLFAALTFTPAMLRLAGRWAFWPQMQTERIRTAPGWLSPTNLISRLMEYGWFSRVWQKIGDALLARPLTIWCASVALMAPFVVVAVVNHDKLSYGLLSELPRNEPSVVGAEAVQAHFPAGATGPVTVLLENRRIDFDTADGRRKIEDLVARVENLKSELQIADIRSVANPFGITETAEEHLAGLTPIQRGIAQKKAYDYYVSDVGSLAGHVTRIDVVFEDDPFFQGSIDRLNRLERFVRDVLPESLAAAARLHYVGPTASIRDLKTVTRRDQIRIDVLVVAAVFIILVILLRRLATAGYLVASVFFSYLVALGATYTVFWMLNPAGFAGLDWKVPIFLFTILIAVGEDYNIYLITRIEEEQRVHGPVQGVTVALRKTGSIISSCGLIMAGTFSSLLAGSLSGMNQLGFALAFGVLLDTFVVRPILVPAYLILLHSGRLGVLGKLLGANDSALPSPLQRSQSVEATAAERRAP